MPIERFSQLGNVILEAQRVEDYRMKKQFGYLAWINVSVAAGKKAPTAKKFFKDQKMDETPELFFLWEDEEAAKRVRTAYEGDADKAENQLNRYMGSEADVDEDKPEEEQRDAVAAEWGGMKLADLEQYKQRKAQRGEEV